MNRNKEILLFFATEWKKRYGEDYPISWGKDSARISRLIKQYGDERLRRWIEYYLTSYRDDFADRCGRHLGAFISAVPKLIVECSNREAAAKIGEHSPDAELIEAARARLVANENHLLPVESFPEGKE